MLSLANIDLAGSFGAQLVGWLVGCISQDTYLLYFYSRFIAQGINHNMICINFLLNVILDSHFLPFSWGSRAEKFMTKNLSLEMNFVEVDTLKIKYKQTNKNRRR